MYITVYCTYELYINRYMQYIDFEFTVVVNTKLIHTTRKFINFYMTYMYASTCIYIRRTQASYVCFHISFWYVLVEGHGQEMMQETSNLF